MSFIHRALALTVLFVVLTVSANAADRAPMRVIDAAHKNILHTLNGVNENMQADAIQTLIELHRQYPEYDFSETIPVLLYLLDSHRSYSVRILSAIAIADISGDTYKDAIQKSAFRDSHSCVRNVCAGIVSERSK